MHGWQFLQPLILRLDSNFARRPRETYPPKAALKAFTRLDAVIAYSPKMTTMTGMATSLGTEPWCFSAYKDTSKKGNTTQNASK